MNCLNGTLKRALQINSYTVNTDTNNILWLFAHTLIYGGNKYFKMSFPAAYKSKLF